MTASEDLLTASLRHGNLQVDITDPAPRPMIAILDARPGLEDTFRARITELVRAVRSEPGCVTFTAYEARDTPRTLLSLRDLHRRRRVRRAPQDSSRPCLHIRHPRAEYRRARKPHPAQRDPHPALARVDKCPHVGVRALFGPDESGSRFYAGGCHSHPGASPCHGYDLLQSAGGGAPAVDSRGGSASAGVWPESSQTSMYQWTTS
jgi:Antibiotic biosynthesis monooxygenase